METTKGGKKSKQTIPQEVRYTINESSRQFPDDAAIACDYKVKLVGVEWLSFQIRIVNCLTDKAKELGIDWWVNNPMFRKDKQKEIAESISHSRFGREVSQQKNAIFILRPGARHSCPNSPTETPDGNQPPDCEWEIASD